MLKGGIVKIYLVCCNSINIAQLSDSNFHSSSCSLRSQDETQRFRINSFKKTDTGYKIRKICKCC